MLLERVVDRFRNTHMVRSIILGTEQRELQRECHIAIPKVHQHSIMVTQTNTKLAYSLYGRVVDLVIIDHIEVFVEVLARH